MLREMVLFLEEFLREHGSPAVVKAAVGLMSFAVLLGAVLGSTAIKAGTLITAIFLIMMTGLALMARHRADRREIEGLRELAARRDRATSPDEPAHEVVDWEEAALIGHRGDTRSRLRVRVRASHGDLHVFRLRFSCGWPQPERYQRNVRMTVRGLLVDGSPGTTLRTLVSWPRPGSMAAIVHFHSPVPAGSEVSFLIELFWPRRCAPLLRGAPDEFNLMFREPTRRATYRILLPKGTDAYVEPVGKTTSFNGIRWRRKTDDHGHQTITFRISEPPVRHRAGVRLQLKNTRRASAPDWAHPA